MSLTVNRQTSFASDDAETSLWSQLREEVHVWHAQLDPPKSLLQQLAAVLSADERARAARFHFASDRDRFVAARGILREILSRYAGLSAAELVFAYGAQGKPELSMGSELQFSVSHSEHLALYAVSRSRRLGIDLERERQDLQLLQVANRFFSPAEHRAISDLPFRDRSRAFVTVWTRKESYIKALGGGLAVPLDRFDVTVCTEKPALLQDRGDRMAQVVWKLHNIDSAPGFIGALCVEGPVRVVRRHDWKER